MIKPQAIKIGDTIGIVAPASPASDERRELARAALEGLGFGVKMGRSCFYKCGYLAGSDELRARDINAMFADSEVSGIICLRGGYGGLRLLERLDYGLINSHPKVFIGYSDITALHIALNQRSQLVTFHGPMAASDLGAGLDQFSLESLLGQIAGTSDNNVLVNPPDEPLAGLVPGQCTGSIVGGNLAVLVATLGTAYEIDTRDKILFMEDIEEKPYRIDRMLTQLYLAGKLQSASGFIVGDWKNCGADPNESWTVAEVLEERLAPLGKPVITNLRSGHCSPMVTIPFGVNCHMDAGIGKLTMKESAVKNG